MALKDRIQELLNGAKSRGWEISRTGKGHWRLEHAKAERPITIAGTPTSYRATKNYEAMIRRAERNAGILPVEPKKLQHRQKQTLADLSSDLERRTGLSIQPMHPTEQAAEVFHDVHVGDPVLEAPQEVGALPDSNGADEETDYRKKPRKHQVIAIELFDKLFAEARSLTGESQAKIIDKLGVRPENLYVWRNEGHVRRVIYQALRGYVLENKQSKTPVNLPPPKPEPMVIERDVPALLARSFTAEDIDLLQIVTALGKDRLPARKNQLSGLLMKLGALSLDMQKPGGTVSPAR